MDLGLDEERLLIVQTVRRFVDKDVRAWAADADRAGAPPPRLVEAGTELGFFVDAVPAEAGGMLEGGFGHLTRALRAVELGRGCAAIAALLETNVEPALATRRWGTLAARAELFAALAAGGLATTGRDSRGTLAIAGEGDGVSITGTIGPLPALGVASHLLLIARAHDGEPLLLLVRSDDDGVTREGLVPSGWRAAQWGTLRCADAQVAGDRVLARGAAATSAIAEVMAWYRIGLAARAVGVATAAMEHAARYGEERIQFGQPIGRFEAVFRLRDDAETATAAARLLVLSAAWHADRSAARPDDDAARASAADLASRARVMAGDVVAKTTIDAVQIFGGYGFVNDFPVEKLMRDARAFEALLGDERLDRVLASKAS